MKSVGIHSVGEAKQSYSKAEFIAEMRSAFFSAIADIVTGDHGDNAGCLAGWTEVLSLNNNQNSFFESGLEDGLQFKALIQILESALNGEVAMAMI